MTTELLRTKAEGQTLIQPPQPRAPQQPEAPSGQAERPEPTQ